MIICIITIGLILSPAVIGQSVFGTDYVNHLWLVGYQAQSIVNTWQPTLFLHTTDVFEPFYGFYGGSLYAIAGYVTVAVGNNPFIGFVLTILLGLVMAYGGMWWLARLMGLKGWVAQAPAVVALTSPYLLTDLYARGAWPEFMALCSITVVLAGALSLAQPRPWTARPLLGFLAGVVVLTGSHNVTLLLATILLTILGAGVLIVARHELAWRRLVAVAVVLILGVGLNAWFLLLDVIRSPETIAAQGTFSWLSTSMFDSFTSIFDPLRSTPEGSTTRGLTVAAPVFALAWAIVVGLSNWKRTKPLDRQLWLLLLLLLGGIIWCMMSQSFWDLVGKPLTSIQFPYRLNGYLLFGCAGLVCVAARTRLDRRQLIGLGIVLVLSIGPAFWQIWHIGNETALTRFPARQTFSQGLETKPTSWYDSDSYADRSQPVVATTRSALIPPLPPGTGSITIDLLVPAGKGPVALNVQGGPYIVGVAGAERLGRTSNGLVVIAAPSSIVATTVTLTIAQAGGSVVAIGRAVTLASMLITILWSLFLFLRRRRPTHRPTPDTNEHVPLLKAGRLEP